MQQVNSPFPLSTQHALHIFSDFSESSKIRRKMFVFFSCFYNILDFFYFTLKSTFLTVLNNVKLTLFKQEPTVCSVVTLRKIIKLSEFYRWVNSIID